MGIWIGLDLDWMGMFLLLLYVCMDGKGVRRGGEWYVWYVWYSMV